MLFVGTTVDDNINGLPLVTQVLIRTFDTVNVTITAEQVNPHRGKNKKQAILDLITTNITLFTNINTLQDTTRTDAIQQLTNDLFIKFESILEEYLENLNTEMYGTTAVFTLLKKYNPDIKIGVGSGFSKKVVEKIVANMKWKEKGLIDYIGSAEQVKNMREASFTTVLLFAVWLSCFMFFSALIELFLLLLRTFCTLRVLVLHQL